MKYPTREREALLEWYDRVHRDLPWRRTKDPYRIWVSEIMLQQTTVSTVLRYFDRFTRNFPTVSDLSRTSLPEVLKLWEGLGYYQRARNLHRAAGMIPLGPSGPEWPRTVEEWMALPGIGRSTAGAIFSISTDTWAPILDANVRRVMERFFGLPPAFPGREARLWKGSDLWGEGNTRPGDTNQALMELGAVVCLPKNPDCPNCPVKESCHSGPLKDGSPIIQPVEAGKRKKPGTGLKKPVRERVALIPETGPLLFEPRNEGRLLEGLLELSGFSSGELAPGEVISEGAFNGFRVLRTLFAVRQTYSHFREVVHVTLVSRGSRMERAPNIAGEGTESSRWSSLAHVEDLGLTGVARKIVLRLQAKGLPEKP